MKEERLREHEDRLLAKLRQQDTEKLAEEKREEQLKRNIEEVKKNMNKEGVEKKSEDIGVNGQKSSEEMLKREEERKRAEEAEIRILERIRLREMAEEEKKLEERKAQLKREQESRAEQMRRAEREAREEKRLEEERLREQQRKDHEARLLAIKQQKEREKAEQEERQREMSRLEEEKKRKEAERLERFKTEQEERARKIKEQREKEEEEARAREKEEMAEMLNEKRKAEEEKLRKEEEEMARMKKEQERIILEATLKARKDVEEKVEDEEREDEDREREEQLEDNKKEDTWDERPVDKEQKESSKEERGEEARNGGMEKEEEPEKASELKEEENVSSELVVEEEEKIGPKEKENLRGDNCEKEKEPSDVSEEKEEPNPSIKCDTASTQEVGDRNNKLSITSDKLGVEKGSLNKEEEEKETEVVVRRKEKKKLDEYLEDAEVKWDLGLEEKTAGGENGRKESAEESPKSSNSDQKVLFRMSMSDFDLEQSSRESTWYNAIAEEGKEVNNENESKEDTEDKEDKDKKDGNDGNENEEEKKEGNNNTNNATDILQSVTDRKFNPNIDSSSEPERKTASQVIENSERLMVDEPDKVDIKVDNGRSEKVDNSDASNGLSARVMRDQDFEAKSAVAEENAENQVKREKSLPPGVDSSNNNKEETNEDKAMSTIVAFEDLGKSCDQAQLEELILLVQAKIEAAKKEKEKQTEMNNKMVNREEEPEVGSTFKRENESCPAASDSAGPLIENSQQQLSESISCDINIASPVATEQSGHEGISGSTEEAESEESAISSNKTEENSGDNPPTAAAAAAVHIAPSPEDTEATQYESKTPVNVLLEKTKPEISEISFPGEKGRSSGDGLGRAFVHTHPPALFQNTTSEKPTSENTTSENTASENTASEETEPLMESSLLRKPSDRESRLDGEDLTSGTMHPSSSSASSSSSLPPDTVDFSQSEYAEEEIGFVEDSSGRENHKRDYPAPEIKFPPKNESDMQCTDAIADAKSRPLVHRDDADTWKEKVSEPVEDTGEYLKPESLDQSLGGDDGFPVAPVRKTRRRSKEANESCHAEATNSSHETEAPPPHPFEGKLKTEAHPFEGKIETEALQPFGDKNSTDLVKESELGKFNTNDKSSTKEGIITEAMSEEVEWALNEKKRHEETRAEKTDLKDSESTRLEHGTRAEETDLKDSESHQQYCDNHPNEKKTDAAEKSEDLVEKERQRKVSEESAKAEKSHLENLMRLVQEKIDKARRAKEKRLAENLEK